jgi:hypothetical protein
MARPGSRPALDGTMSRAFTPATRMAGLLAGMVVVAVVVAALVAPAQASAQPAPAGLLDWTAEERAAIAGLWIGNLPPLPADPSP